MTNKEQGRRSKIAIIITKPFSMTKKFDLDERLIEFASTIIDISEALPKTFAGSHIAGQLVRSDTSPALHYGEAQSAESRNNFYS
jgi:hypothetical protein